VNTGYGPLNITGVSFTGANPGQFTQTNTCNAVLNFGNTCTITVTFAPVALGAASASLSIASNDPINSVLSLPVTGFGNANVTITASSATIPYGSAVPTITRTITGLIPPDTAAVLGAINCTTTYTVGRQVGSYPTTCTGAANPNYIITYVAGSITVTPVSLTVTAANQNINFGFPVPTLTYTITGFVNGDTATSGAISGKPSLTTTAVQGTAAGNYPITATLGGLRAVNYTFTFVNATLTINPGPAIGFSPASLSFGNQLINTNSATKTVTLTNTGSAKLLFTGVVTGTNASSFSKYSTCSGPLAPGASCTITVTFTPIATGAATAALTFTDTAYGSPQSVQLSGTGTAPAVRLSLASLVFGNQNINTSSASLPVTLTNSGTSTLTFSAALTGPNASLFSQSSNCTGSLAAGASCIYNVVFKPIANGAATATLTLTDNAAGSPHTVQLSGTGTAPVVSLSLTTLAFGNQKVNVTSAPLQTTLTNTGTGTLTFVGVLTGTNAASFTKWSNCTGPLAPGASCTVNFAFTPTAIGPATAALTITDNAAGSPHSVALTGTGN
jgi:hypothetical protein